MSGMNHFIDDEIELLIQAVNNNQMFFHPKYASEGKFIVKKHVTEVV